MGEINLPSPVNGKRKPKTKKLSTRVDLTPMVDLGFLLITFFIFTTSMTEPTAMKLAVPHDTRSDPNETPESKTINLIIAAYNKVLYYQGTDIDSAHTIGSSGESIRSAIISKKNLLKKQFGKSDDIVVLIKPTDNASYESVVNILDEMTINNVKRYVLMDPSAEENRLALEIAPTF